MKPRVFIGSSSEGLAIANAIQQNMDRECDCIVWTQGVFGVSSYPVESLFAVVRQNDFGVFVLSPDDSVRMRNTQLAAARDNVILESGLFMGRYGKDRTFLVTPRGVPDFHIPTDLLGMTPADYDPSRIDTNAQAALGPACTSIVTAIKSHPVMTTQLTFALSVTRDHSPFPLKLGIEIRNATGLSVLVSSRYFETKGNLRPDPHAKGNPAKRQYEIKFAPPGGNWLNQFEVLLHPNHAAATWMPLDPSHTEAEVRASLDARSCGEWHYACDWLGPNGWHREYLEPM